MKEFLIGLSVGSIITGVVTWKLTKEKTEKDTINALREELLTSCMKEVGLTIDGKPLDEEHKVVDITSKRGKRANNQTTDEVDKEELYKQSEAIDSEITKRDYRKYYKTNDVTPQEEPVRDDDPTKEEVDMEELSDRHTQMSQEHPYEILTVEEYNHSEWDTIYGKETLIYYIPDECMVEDGGNILCYEDVIEMLGPDFEGELRAKGKCYVRNHRLETTYEVLASAISMPAEVEEEDEEYVDEE